MNVFEFDDYKAFVTARITSMARRGRGELQKIANELGMHSTRVSHVFRGDVHLTLEQASRLCNYWGLTQIESEFFLLLVQLARAGTKDLRAILKKQIADIRDRSQQLVNRVPRDHTLSESEKALFYSNWVYSGIRLLTSIKGFQTLDTIAERVNLSRERTREILDFLVNVGLCNENGGVYSMGAKRTHLEASSMLVTRHHANWRMKAIQRHEHLSNRELAYTVPVSINRKDQKVLRELLIETITKFQATVTASEPEDTLACLNIDWFEF